MSTRLCRWAQRTFRFRELAQELVGQIQELTQELAQELVGLIQELTQQLVHQLAMIQQKSALQNIKWFSNALASLTATCCS